MHNNSTIEVQISNLVPSSRNVRKSKPGKEADQELLAGIREVGLLQNLVVIQNSKPGMYEVVAGKRRLKALQQLVKEGHYPETHTVPCQWVGDATNAVQISLIENTQRMRMHPADEFEACYKLLKSGTGIESIAAALGIPESTVKKRLKLAQVAPQIITAFRNDELTLETVMAFTVEEDQARQLELLERIRSGELFPSDRNIRNELRGDTETNKTRLGKFVGESAYTKAGGAVSHDLFQETTYFIDRELLLSLAITRLEKAAAKLEGWNWVEITPDRNNADIHAMQRIQGYDGPETAKLREKLHEIDQLIGKLDQIQEESETHEEWNSAHGEQYERLENQLETLEDEITATLQYKPEEQALAGCIVTIDHASRLEIIEGLIRKGDEKALRELQSPAKRTQSAGAISPGTGEHNPASDQGEDISQALENDLTTYRANIAKRFLAIGGEVVARDLLYYTLCMHTFNTHYWGPPLDIRIDQTHPEAGLKKPDTGRALQELAEFRDSLKLDWLHIESDAKRFQAFTELKHNDKTNLMAYCVASSLRCALADQDRDDEVEAALEMLDIPWHKYFQPTYDNYLSRVSKDTLQQLGAKFFTDYRLEGADNRTKKQLASELEEIFAGEDKSMPASKRAEAIDWIPAGFKPV